MKIFELLSGAAEPLDNNQGSTGGSFATPQMDAMSGTQPQQPPQQQANMLTDFFMSGPKPISGTSPGTPNPAPPQPAGAPPAQTSGMISRPFGGSAVGQGLDAINTALKPQ